MKVGDLVQYRDSEWSPVGLVMGFDKEDDPIILFVDNSEVDWPTAYHREDVKVVSEAKSR